MNLTRVLEFLTVLIVFTFVLFSPIFTLITFCLLSWFWSFPLTLTLFLLYGCWAYFDRHTDSRGSRWSNRLRQSSICTYFTNYFPLKLIKSEDLDPNRNYIFGYHPHGAFSFGAAGNFLTDATHFCTLFPNIRPHLMILRLQFLLPFIRDLFLNLGTCCASRDSINYFLNGQQGQGHAVVIVIGGIREQNLSKNDTMILYLKKRQGFIKLALENGASLVPVIGFGENELYRRYRCFNLFPNGIPWGRFIFGHIPLRHPVTTVVGKAIHVNKNVNATTEDIDQLHCDYMQAVEQLFEYNKNKYGLGHVTLEII